MSWGGKGLHASQIDDLQATSFHPSTHFQMSSYGAGNTGCLPVVRPVAWSSIVSAPICKGRFIVRFDGVCTGSSNCKVNAPGILVCRSKLFGLSDQEFRGYSAFLMSTFTTADKFREQGKEFPQRSASAMIRDG